MKQPVPLKKLEDLNISVVIYPSPKDGVPIVQIDTRGIPDGPDGPKIRVYLNDGDIFEGVPYPDD